MGGFVNKRAHEIWGLVTPHANFTDKTVVDIGCGPADFVRLALHAGAKHVAGIDMDYATLLDGDVALKESGQLPNKAYTLLCDDINTLVSEHNLDFRADIAICFSCLPYLNDYNGALEWIKDMGSECALIESQYYGDGPGPIFLSGDDDMHTLLLRYWKTAKKLGETDTRIRDACRSLWLCQG